MNARLFYGPGTSLVGLQHRSLRGRDPRTKYYIYGSWYSARIRAVVPEGRPVLVPSFVLIFSMLQDHAKCFIGSFVRPISSFLPHLLATSSQISGFDAALGPCLCS